jgi:dihydrofolate synthase/folylpolyglutamate synthase
VLRTAGEPGSISEHTSIASAYAHAQERASLDDRIVAFGSFLTVAEAVRAIHAGRS